MSSGIPPSKISFGWLRGVLRPFADAVEVPPGAVRIVIIVGSAILFPAYPLACVAALWLAVVWLVPRTIQYRRELRQQKPLPDSVTEAFAEYLQIELAMAHEQIVRLQDEVKAAKRSAKGPASERTESRGHPVYRRVGLDQDCPRWVAEIVRREYRKRLHPDTKPAPQKGEAERRFKETEQIFAEIWRQRGF